jgi:shikimate dehydrogenase
MRVGLIGHPVAHSRSPAMQQAAFDALGLATRYELWDTPPAALPARVAGLRAADVLGANVTIPHKLAVLPLLDRVAGEGVRVAGAVNTIVCERAGQDVAVRLVGYNTDVVGLAATLRELGAWPEGRRVVVLGAGGTAQMVAGLVAHAGAASLALGARRPAAAAALLASTEQRLGRLPARTHTLDLADGAAMGTALAGCDLLINATSVGMGDGSACPIAPEWLARLPAGGAVLDVIYTPTETALLRAARAAGLAAVNGLPLLLHQGAAAFELWAGQAAPLAVMRAALGLD